MKLYRVLCSSINKNNKLVTARVYKYVNRFDGFPKNTDLKLVEEELPPIKDGVLKNKSLIDSKQIYVDRYSIFTKTDQWLVGINQMHEWIKEGKIKYKETVTNGFENMFEAFINMLQGGNTGKAVVKIK